MAEDCCGSACAPGNLHDPDRALLVSRAFSLEWLTVAWLVIEAAVAIDAGIAADSLTLTAFGIDSIIELISASVLIWRLSIELRLGQAFSETAEHLASRIGGGLLLTLAAYLIGAATWSLWTQQGETFSALGLIVSVLSIPIMYYLARRKLILAEKLGSRAMRADAVESITCGWLAGVVVVGLAAQALVGAWWIDAVTSLGIVWFLVKEGREAWEGEECCDD